VTVGGRVPLAAGLAVVAFAHEGAGGQAGDAGDGGEAQQGLEGCLRVAQRNRGTGRGIAKDLGSYVHRGPEAVVVVGDHAEGRGVARTQQLATGDVAVAVVALLKAVEEEIAFGVEGEGLEGNVGDAGLGADPGVRFMGNDLEYVVIGQIAWAGKEIRARINWCVRDKEDRAVIGCEPQVIVACGDPGQREDRESVFGVQRSCGAACEAGSIKAMRRGLPMVAVGIFDFLRERPLHGFEDGAGDSPVVEGIG
jgi:hypothetical protein